MKWASLTASTTEAFTLPTSVTRPFGFPAMASRAVAAMAETGVAMNVMLALRSMPPSSIAPMPRARSTRSGSSSWPLTCHPRERSAKPRDPPIRPRPTMAARESGGSLGAGSGTAGERIGSVCANGLLERSHLDEGQGSPLPRREMSILEWTDANPYETTHRMAHCLAHAANLTIAALVDGEADDVGLGERSLRRRGHTVVERDAVAERSQRARRGLALDMREILLLDSERRMRQAMREFPVVREDQQTLGIGVETAHRPDPRLFGHEV